MELVDGGRMVAYCSGWHQSVVKSSTSGTSPKTLQGYVGTVVKYVSGSIFTKCSTDSPVYEYSQDHRFSKHG